MQVILTVPRIVPCSISVVSFITAPHSAVSVNRSVCGETNNPIMFSGAVPNVPDVSHSIL